ncbi:hypothetical protein F0237_19595 [Vibrio tubiashii]|uniref:Uncharacterized protein n=1 Tax=Vibrio tubiashii TaxID=29498 RepID=A0AAE5GU40_9VIBR|nr:hypothetical protein [Vibrio tubiashii]
MVLAETNWSPLFYALRLENLERATPYGTLRYWKAGSGFALRGEGRSCIPSFPRLTEEGVGNLHKSSTSLKSALTHSYLVLEDDMVTY